ncbi:MAG: lipopolysaccharide biosynthesis protein [Alsobacter sp.]
MLVLASFLANAAANFALGLVLARALGPAAFGAFALALAAAGALTVPAVEWLRHAATRFTRREPGPEAEAVRATLDAAMAGMALLLLATALVVAFALPATLAAASARLLLPAAVLTASGAFFDVHAALARALGRSGLYALLVAGRSLVVVGTMAVTGLLTAEPGIVVDAGAAASLLALACARLALRSSRAGLPRAEFARGLSFARYGLPLVAAGAVALLQAFLNRSSVAGHAGLAAAGQFALAWDLMIRILAAMGTAADVLLLPVAVHAAHTDGPDAARRQVARNAVLVWAALLPAAAGLAAIMPVVEPWLVGPDFRGPFGTLSLALLPGMLAWALLQFAVGPAFQIAGRTWPLVVPAAAGLAANLALAAAGGAADGALGQAWSFSLAMGAALLLGLAMASRTALLRICWRDVLGVAAAAAAMALYAGVVARSAAGAASLPLAVLGGGSLYLWLLILLDVAGLGSRLRARQTLVTA